MPDAAQDAPNPFAALVGERMDALDLGPKEVSERMKEVLPRDRSITPQQVSNYRLKGSMPAADKVVPLARALGVPVAEVLTALGTPPPGDERRLYDIHEEPAEPEADAAPTGDSGVPPHFRGPVFFRLKTSDGRVISEHRADGYQVGNPVEVVVEGG